MNEEDFMSNITWEIIAEETSLVFGDIYIYIYIYIYFALYNYISVN